MSPSPQPLPDTPTVFVVDDDNDLRESLLVLLGALGHTAQGFASAEEFDRHFQRSVPGCLLLDIRMPGRSGIDLYADLMKSGRRIPVIFITGHADVATAVEAMKTGAIEFLEKPFNRMTLGMLVERALELDRKWRQSDNRYRELDEAIRQLSPTDLETLNMIVEGLPNKVMASRLLISLRGVELRRQRLMKRLGVRSVAELLELTITHRVLAELRSVDRSQPLR